MRSNQFTVTLIASLFLANCQHQPQKKSPTFVDCGTTQITIAERVANCELLNGTAATKRSWSLVTHANSSQEVWLDQKTKLLWSSVLIPPDLVIQNGGDNWCRAAGYAEDSTGYCNSKRYQPSFPEVIESYCEEGWGLGPVPGWCDNREAYGSGQDCLKAGGNWTPNTENYEANSASYSPAKGGMGANSRPKVTWRLPSKWDYQKADSDGMRFVISDSGVLANNYEWTSSVIYSYHHATWLYYGYNHQSDHYAVRCVGHAD